VKKHVVGLDIGTSDCKTLVVDSSGEILGKGSSTLEPFFSRSPAWAEQHPQDWWKKICLVTKEAMKRSGVQKNRIAALSIATQRRTFVAVDEEGNPLRPAILWLDRRAPIKMSLRLRWLREYEPGIYEKTHKFLGVQAWLIHRLTGSWKDSMAAQFASDLQDMETWDWDQTILDAGSIDRELLPDLVMPGEEVGNLTEKAARMTGLPAGLPVIAGSGDKQSGTIGAGCFGKDKLLISYGTALSLGSTSREIPEYPLVTELSGIPFAYDAQLGLSGGFWTVKWFTDQFVSTFNEMNDVKDMTPFKVLDSEAAKVPVGAQGLIVLPHWWGGRWGQVIPHSEDRGSVIGWTGTHTRAHFYRALLEGIIHEARTYKDLMERHLRTTFTDIRVAGGGSRSDLVMQMTADVLGQPVSRIQTTSAEALGAAMTAAKGAGFYETVEEAVVNMNQLREKFIPIPSNQEVYDILHRRVYQKMYWATKEINTAVDEIGI
jgi:sugar (pentulose or hexulose) kinase